MKILTDDDDHEDGDALTLNGLYHWLIECIWSYGRYAVKILWRMLLVDKIPIGIVLMEFLLESPHLFGYYLINKIHGPDYDAYLDHRMSHQIDNIYIETIRRWFSCRRAVPYRLPCVKFVIQIARIYCNHNDHTALMPIYVWHTNTQRLNSLGEIYC